MQVIETLAEGLKRELKVVIPAKDMEAQMNERLADVKDRVRINGFRPGKVPVAHLKKIYGKSIMADLVNEIIRDKPTDDPVRARRKVGDPAGNRHDRGPGRSREDPRRPGRLRVHAVLRNHPADRAEGRLRHQGHPRSRRDRRQGSRRADPQDRRERPHLRNQEGQGRRGRPRHHGLRSARSTARPSRAARTRTPSCVLGSSRFIPGLRRPAGRRSRPATRRPSP